MSSPNSYTQKKPRQCHQQAIFTLQKIFPEVNLSQLSKNSSVWQMLEVHFSQQKKKSAKNLPRPGLGDITSTITNMKSVVDNQQLKIQKNMIEIQRQQEIIMSTQKLQQQQYQQQRLLAGKNISNKYNNDYPTATKLQFKNHQNDNFQSSSSYYPEQESSYQHINHQMDEQDDYEKIQIESKDKFFGDDDEIDYFTPCNPVRGSFIDDVVDQEEDVKKYLSFDF